MKRIFLILLMIVANHCLIHSQDNLVPINKQDTLLVSDVKTTHLLFDKKIKYVDIGSPYFVADTLPQMIRLKHIGEELIDSRSQLSNLTVITDDGGYYSIALGYDRFAQSVTYKVKASDHLVTVFKKEEQEEKEKVDQFEGLCNQLARHSRNILNLKDGKKGDLRIEVAGIYYVEEKIAVRIALKNESTLDFDIDNILFRTKLRKRMSKDYLYQERVISPIYTCTDNFEIIGHGEQSVTLLFNKFMLNENEKLAIDIFEENGGRSVSIDIPRERLLRPKII
ncbi:DUF4138 domain-containing protein [Aquimarina sp. D1M17]|uniref:DUF4138 domain-containing protein n=1 Tax=Aquimarina acroporae TaxID=2937283 RepID=UPI0020BED74D|nr:DUF4138 domain-containing protein [Aquimarina acroporae]MCK8521186.1 DUF4138 domain-containing protein [Aquimarina acroporae]